MAKAATAMLLAGLLAGCAGAGGWRSLTIDASSESSFEASVASLQQALPDGHRARFDRALADIWVGGTIYAGTLGSGEYTPADYFDDLDGLKYRNVIDLATSNESQILDQYLSTRASRGRLRVPDPGFSPPNRSGFTESQRGWNRTQLATSSFATPGTSTTRPVIQAR